MADELPEILAANQLGPLRGVTQTEGQRWTQFSETELVGLIGWHGANQARDAAAAEIQRRLIVAVRAGSDSADKYAGEVVDLTRALKAYTIVLAIIGAIQIALMLFWKSGP